MVQQPCWQHRSRAAAQHCSQLAARHCSTPVDNLQQVVRFYARRQGSLQLVFQCWPQRTGSKKGIGRQVADKLKKVAAIVAESRTRFTVRDRQTEMKADLRHKSATAMLHLSICSTPVALQWFGKMLGLVQCVIPKCYSQIILFA